MIKYKSLNELKVGESAIITSIDPKNDIRQRLYDLGFIKGAHVDCIGKAPAGEPTAFGVNSAVIALRCEECQSIMTSSVKEEYDYGTH